MVKPGEKKKPSSQPVNLPSAWPLIKCLSGRNGKVVEGSRVWHVYESERLSPISFIEIRESNPKSPFLYP